MIKKPVMHSPSVFPPGAVTLRQGFGVPLVCVSPTGGAGLFAPLARKLPANTLVIGLESTQVPIEILVCETVEEQSDRLLGLLRLVQPRGPYRLLGFSFGAYVAYEMARRLVDENEPVEYLGILDTGPVDRDGSAVLRRLRRVLSLLGKIPSRAAMAFRARRLVADGLASLLRDCFRVNHKGSASEPLMSAGERLEVIRLDVLKYGGREVQDLNGATQPNGGDESEGRAIQLQVARKVYADKQAIGAYQMVPIGARLHLYASGREKRPGARASLERRWRDYAREGLDTHWFECGHMELMREPVVARTIAQALAELDEAG